MRGARIGIRARKHARDLGHARITFDRRDLRGRPSVIEGARDDEVAVSEGRDLRQVRDDEHLVIARECP